MKEEKSSPIQQVIDGFWKGIGAGIAGGFLLVLGRLLQYIKLIPGEAVRWVSNLIPTQKGASTASHLLWRFGLGVIVVSFFYVFWRENKYVSRMYKKRDALELGLLKPEDLTPEEFTFIHSHWPELFINHNAPYSGRAT
ncbi:MAG TPA: hypothetical protein VN873_05715 [Candidatus Angelobacter sp.]|nr:hypothetical protein [Candidatus Angelobacter sp.]